jgi:hypothetical protein
MLKKLTPKELKAQVNDKHTLVMRISELSMAKLMDLYSTCADKDQRIGNFAGNVMELAINRAHKDLPTYID